MPNQLFPAAVLTLASAIACACPALAGEIAKVEVSNLTYKPDETTVRVGDTVVWANEDFVAHTVTVKSAAGKTEVLLPAGKSAELSFAEPGTIEYFCRFHPNMKARIVVLAK